MDNLDAHREGIRQRMENINNVGEDSWRGRLLAHIEAGCYSLRGEYMRAKTILDSRPLISL